MVGRTQDVSRHLVTDEHQPRFSVDLDYMRCAALHNYILEAGWLGSGRTLDELLSERRTWFETYGEDAQSVRENLTPGLVEFLNLAYVVDSRTHKFFFWSDSLSDPVELWENQNPDLQDEGQEFRFVTLYPVNSQQSEHGDGLNYDQKDNRAIVQMDMMYDEITRREDDPPPWQPLETILSAWIELLHMDKVTASPKLDRPINEKYDPWVNHRFSGAQVDEAVNILTRLSEAIESRMPTSAGVTPQNKALPSRRSWSMQIFHPNHLLVYSALEPAGHASSSLLLMIFASSQAFSATDLDGEGAYVAPTIFFIAQDRSCALGRNGYPFTWAFRNVKDFPAGLYLTGADLGDENVSQASCRLVLPFRIGGNDFARKSDHTRFENASDLYQLGLPPYGGNPRSQRFVKILESWLTMIEDGHWQAGSQGVCGGLEAFQMAATAQLCEQFYIKPTW